MTFLSSLKQTKIKEIMFHGFETRRGNQVEARRAICFIASVDFEKEIFLSFGELAVQLLTLERTSRHVMRWKKIVLFICVTAESKQKHKFWVEITKLCHPQLKWFSAATDDFTHRHLTSNGILQGLQAMKTESLSFYSSAICSLLFTSGGPTLMDSLSCRWLKQTFQKLGLCQGFDIKTLESHKTKLLQ